MRRPLTSVRIVVASALLGALALTALADDANAPATAGPILTRSRFNAVVAGLKDNGLLWQKGMDVDPGPEADLRAIFFTPRNVGVLTDVLADMPTDPNGLYASARLLRQLTYSRADTIREALPAVKDLCTRASKLYKDFPPLTEHQLKFLKEPTGAGAAALAALKKRQDAKIARETPIARVNEAVYTIQGRTYQLMALSHDTDQYKELAETLIKTEQDRTGVFLIVIQALAAEARRMSPEEGQTLYDILRPAALELKMERPRSYYNFGAPILKRDGVSTYETTTVYPGITVLKMLNRIVTACRSAKAPALKAPKERDIERYWREKERAAKKGR